MPIFLFVIWKRIISCYIFRTFTQLIHQNTNSTRNIVYCKAAISIIYPCLSVTNAVKCKTIESMGLAMHHFV